MLPDAPNCGWNGLACLKAREPSVLGATLDDEKRFFLLFVPVLRIIDIWYRIRPPVGVCLPIDGQGASARADGTWLCM